MDKQKYIFFVMAFSAFLSFSFSLSIEDLLKGYAENDIQLKEFDIKLKQGLLEAKKTALTYGTNIMLSTGNIDITLDGPQTHFSISPELRLSLPALNNTVISASVPTKITTADSSSGGETKVGLIGAGVKISTDIISGKQAARRLALEKAERSVALIRYSLENRVLAVEKSFWQSLNSLYASAGTSAKAQSSLITAQKDLETVKTQGYAKTSSKYRTVELTVKTTERMLEESQRLFTNALAEFASKCGFSVQDIPSLPEIPASIEAKPLVSIAEFDPAKYSLLEERLWILAYNEKVRNADKAFNLSADTSYSYTGNNAGGGKTLSGTNNVGAGLRADWRGIKGGLGFSLPIETPTKPSFNLSLSWDLNAGRISALNKQDKQYAAALENLAVNEAQNSWKQQVSTYLTKIKDLQWQREKTQEELSLYSELYTDSQIWFKQGIISASELLQAKTNYEQAWYRKSSAVLDGLIYNLEVSQLFIKGT